MGNGKEVAVIQQTLIKQHFTLYTKQCFLWSCFHYTQSAVWDVADSQLMLTESDTTKKQILSVFCALNQMLNFFTQLCI